MKLYKHYILYLSVCLGLWALSFGTSKAEAKDFVVVIDAGHGGHDPGAIGKISKEKNINLKVALKLGKQITQNCPDVKVIYTRNRDVFIPLNRRAEIANNAKANLFISIHTNSVANGKSVKGASTWTLGLAKSNANLEVAKRENAVILYEDDYQTRYAGFDPNSAESYIIFEFMQDKYMEESVHLASLVQNQFKNTCKRTDRGVHQAGFLVLKASAMPSILIELGFISNPEEERYLNSEAGSTSLAKGIFQAFTAYKREYEMKQNGNSSEALYADKETTIEKDRLSNSTQPRTATAQTDDELIFKVQILTSAKRLSPNDKRLKGVKAEYYREGGLYKYVCGASADYNQTLRTKQKLNSKFKDAFVVAFKNGNRTDIKAAIQEFKKKNSQK